jgi:hypothetical protein
MPIAPATRYFLVLGLFGVVAALIVWGGVAGRRAGAMALPTGFDGRIIWCSATEAILGGSIPDESGSFQNPIDATEASLVMQSTTSGSVMRKLGAGFVLSASRASPDVLLAIRMEQPSAPGERTQILRSNDFGRTWITQPIDERKFIGVAFDSVEHGYAWSYSRVYRTGDSGRSWTSVEFSPGLLARDNASERPVLGEDGALWAPISDNPRDEARVVRIVRIDPDLTHAVVLRFDRVFISGMAVDRAGGLWVLQENFGSHEVRLVHYSLDRERAQPGTESTVWRAASASGAEFQMRGQRLLVKYDKLSHPPDGFLGKAPRIVETSDDLGRSWTRADVTGAALNSVCLAENGALWEASRSQGTVSVSSR